MEPVFEASSFRNVTHFIHSWSILWGETLYEKRFQIPHNRLRDLTPASKELEAIVNMIRSLVRDRTFGSFCSPPRTIGVELR